jgi:DNA-binding CsgD family transcriptional regulator
MIVVDTSRIIILINGIFQLGILSLFFLSSIRVAVKLAVSWKSGKLLMRIILSIVFIIFILAVFSIDVAYGVWSKIHSQRELSLFYVFPAFLTILSILLTAYTVFSVRKNNAERSGSSIDALKTYGLSPRELEVASLITEGRSYKEAADKLCVSLATVQSHIKSIYRKTGVSSKIELANLCKNGGPLSV